MRAIIVMKLVCVIGVAIAVAQIANSNAFAQFGPGTKAQTVPPVAPADPAAAAGPAAPAVAGAPNAMFAAIDADGDGVITTKELRKAIVALKQLDTDKDGNITLAEAGGGAQPAVAAGGAAPMNNNAQQLVDRLLDGDTDKDGKLSGGELPAEITQQMARDADTNQDGGLDRAELTAAIERMQNQLPNAAGLLPGGWSPGGANGGRSDTTQAASIFRRYDTNGDGKLSVTEVPAAMRNADKDGDHYISPGELQEFVLSMGDRARAMMMGPNGPASNGPAPGSVNRPGRNGGRN